MPGAPACAWTLSLTPLAPESSTRCSHVYTSHETVRPCSLNEQLISPVTAFHLFCFLPQAPNPVQEDPPRASWVTVQVWGGPLPGGSLGGALEKEGGGSSQLLLCAPLKPGSFGKRSGAGCSVQGSKTAGAGQPKSGVLPAGGAIQQRPCRSEVSL